MIVRDFGDGSDAPLTSIKFGKNEARTKSSTSALKASFRSKTTVNPTCSGRLVYRS